MTGFSSPFPSPLSITPFHHPFSSPFFITLFHHPFPSPLIFKDLRNSLTSLPTRCVWLTAGASALRNPSRIREAAQISQSQFAKLIGVNLRTLQNWEQHRTQPTGSAGALFKIVASNPKVIEALDGQIWPVSGWAKTWPVSDGAPRRMFWKCDSDPKGTFWFSSSVEFDHRQSA